MAIRTSYIQTTRNDKTNTFAGDVTFQKDLTIQGDLTFGSAVVDTLIMNGRMATSTIAGAALQLDSTYTYGELFELRCKVTSWTGIAGSFKGYYLRAEAGVGNASYGMRGAEIFGVSNITSGVTGLNQLSALYTSAYVKAAAVSYTIPYVYSIEANVGTEAVTALTVTQAACLYATLQTTSGLADYTKWHGIIVEGGDASARTYGHAIVIQNPTWSGCAATTWTTGLYITEACTTGIGINTTCTRAIRVGGANDWGLGGTGLTVSATDPLVQVLGKITTNTAAGAYASSYNQLALTVTQTNGVSMFASWNELYITGGTIVLTGTGNYAGVYGYVEVAGTVTTSTGNLTALNGSLTIPATLTNNGVIAGVQVDMILNNGYSDNGIIAAYAIGEHTDPGQNKIPIGFYMPYNATKRGLLFGAPWAGSGSTGLKILTDNTTYNTGATVGIYFDDGGTALTAWGEGFTVGTAVLTDSTGSAQTGWPYTAFFYTDVEANITSATNQHWPTLMTSFIVGGSKTLRGFSVGASSHHASVDVNGTLYTGSKLSCISFGGNWSGGTVNGTIVPLHVRPTNGAWSAFLQIDDGAGGCVTPTLASGGTSQYLKVIYNDVNYTILMTRNS